MRFSRAFAGLFAGAAVSGITLTTAFAATNTVTVQPGDSMWKIARSHGISVQSVEAANPSVNPYDMLVGTQLQLPTSYSTSSVTSSYDIAGNLYWMEHIINAEAGGQSLQAQIAVGDVIKHRMESSVYGGGSGSSVYDVVFQKTNGVYQFTSVQNGYIYHAPNASSIEAANYVLQDGIDEVPGAMVFYNPAQTPAHNWVWSQPEIKQIGDLVFAK